MDEISLAFFLFSPDLSTHHLQPEDYPIDPALQHTLLKIISVNVVCKAMQ